MFGKKPSCSNTSSTPKRARKGISLDYKLDVLKRFDAREELLLKSKSKTLGLCYLYTQTTVGTIGYNKEKIKGSAKVATPLSARTLYFHRSEVMPNMERLLSVWIEYQIQ
ncbi:CENPB DNA-binding domain-containing protein 1-like, partial [Limulus polyphemus]|uniref:CENPB DNA-binding domain-containing protein 1-like n=1 Tax=Limulus polyphemus TaxID=6850 RepID=A0ABM1C4A2_LIMPO